MSRRGATHAPTHATVRATQQRRSSPDPDVIVPQVGVEPAEETQATGAQRSVANR